MPFKNRLISSLAAAAASMGFAALSTSAMADQLADIKAKGSLVCGVLGTSKPFSFPNPQTREIQGYDVDFCSAVAKSLGVKLEIKPISVAARIPELTQKRIDVIAANLGWTAERAQQIAYSDAYYVALQKVAVKRGAFARSTDLAGKRVSATKGSTSEIAIRAFLPTATPVTFQDPPPAFLALQQGKVDGFVVTEMVLVQLKAQSEADHPIDILEPPLAEEFWGIGMRKEETALSGHVNKTLRQMEASGEAARIFDKWMGAGTDFKMKRGFVVKPVQG
ncbi:ABC transporter substrate-binding protein [Alicycliphilus denitrificans]|uniref:ABC transporter substrate-binding protein n=1 Tax=Alicycliphilus denitrificans TaxID=179636 RepID=UPI0001D9E7C3|nr:ABC transporter substrate-binding protein [Alicycliphilus denitrificans]ADU98765.1 extracellular solute-binding protein family 3 [Alicycliphilus denitrificans BC]GAO20375.1 ABC transporter substrate-binding protein [Alicycliphilus sp. B1]